MRIGYQRIRPCAAAPTRATTGSAGYDVVGLAVVWESMHGTHDPAVPLGGYVLWPGRRIRVGTGLSLEIPPGYEMQVRSRSGLASDGIVVANSPGTVDSDYRGELLVLLHNLGTEAYTLRPGQKVAQIVVAEVVDVGFAPVGELSETARGAGGFGSTGI